MVTGDLCWLDTVPSAAGVPGRGAHLPPVPGHPGAQAGPGGLAHQQQQQQQQQLHVGLAAGHDGQLPGHLCARCLPAAPHDVGHQPPRQGKWLVTPPRKPSAAVQ